MEFPGTDQEGPGRKPWDWGSEFQLLWGWQKLKKGFKKNSKINLNNKHNSLQDASLIFNAHLLAGEDCGVAPFPNHTSSILVRTLLMNPALDITFSLVERLVMVDSGCGRDTGPQCGNVLYIFTKYRKQPFWYYQLKKQTL